MSYRVPIINLANVLLKGVRNTKVNSSPIKLSFDFINLLCILNIDLERASSVSSTIKLLTGQPFTTSNSSLFLKCSLY